MAKGDDALRRKRNKVIRKRLRNSESSVTARVAAIIASKRRRKAGRRRICEGMCFSLPTEDDPFNERPEKKMAMEKEKDSKNQKLNRRDNKRNNSDTDLVTDTNHQQKLNCDSKEEERLLKNTIVKTEGNIVSKYLLLCLKAVENTWLEEGTLNKGMAWTLLSNSWGADFCKSCSSGSSLVVTGEAFATREQVAWLVSTAADVITRNEKQGIVVPSPFLLFLVSSGDRAVEVRSLCKPLKDLGIHTVSLHPGTSLDHQIQGKKDHLPVHHEGFLLKIWRRYDSRSS